MSNARQPVPPNKRRRLQQCFEHGNRSAAKGDFDYAVNMFTQCVVGDPANSIYAQQFLKTLYQKYNNNKKGGTLASLKGAGHKGSIKKASMQKDWAAVIASGLDMLKLNPWDVGTLTAMAGACDQLGCPETQLVYLNGALESDRKDAEVNRLCGRALARVGQFDGAIACWRRVEQAKPGDEEARRAIGNLAVEKTIHHGGYEDAETSTDVRSARTAKGDQDSGDVPQTPEQKLEKQISKSPEDESLYVELADLHTRNERFPEAVAALERALAASGGNISIREKLEDAQLRGKRTQLAIAQRRFQDEQTPEAADLAKGLKTELNQLELEVYRSRVDRYPTQLGLKYELGLRLKRAGQFNDAIKLLQDARADGKRRATAHLELGECFQHIKRYKLAMDSYEVAIVETPEREVEQRKLALYRAGVLAVGLAKQEPPYLDVGEKHLTQLAGLDFGYRDVAAWLDKIAHMRNKG